MNINTYDWFPDTLAEQYNIIYFLLAMFVVNMTFNTADAFQIAVENQKKEYDAGIRTTSGKKKPLKEYWHMSILISDQAKKLTIVFALLFVTAMMFPRNPEIYKETIQNETYIFSFLASIGTAFYVESLFVHLQMDRVLSNICSIIKQVRGEKNE